MKVRIIRFASSIRAPPLHATVNARHLRLCPFDRGDSGVTAERISQRSGDDDLHIIQCDGRACAPRPAISLFMVAQASTYSMMLLGVGIGWPSSFKPSI
jgi:hypothetical protein